ncbi:hypothetical protein AOLI_G00227540 [Acnodon oligacanthus]
MSLDILLLQHHQASLCLESTAISQQLRSSCIHHAFSYSPLGSRFANDGITPPLSMVFGIWITEDADHASKSQQTTSRGNKQVWKHKSTKQAAGTTAVNWFYSKGNIALGLYV